jgi:hypothetical protein
LSPYFPSLDLVACLVSFALFSLFALVPGYTFAWLADLFAFQKRSLPARIAISIPLSIGLSPILGYLTGRFLSMTAVWFVFGSIWMLFVALVVRESLATHPKARVRAPIAYAAIVGGWLVAGLLSLIDLQFKDRLYFSVVSFDYELRSALVSAISRTGIPQANPPFYPGYAVPLR